MNKTNGTSVKSPDLLTKMIADQNELGYSDEKYAKIVLHISRPQWTQIRHHNRKLYSALPGLAKAYPPKLNAYGAEIEPGKFDKAIIAFLRDGKS